jgi:hypothetical protein
MAKELLSVRCPEDIAQIIQEQMEMTGQDRTTVVIDMLRSSGSFLSLSIEEKSKLPSISAIYFVFASNKLLYVGRSVDLKQRWQNHHRYSQFKLIQDARIAWFECDSNLLPEFESSLIEFLEPDYNRSPDGLLSDGKIQYRLSEDELELLKLQVKDGESIHLAAKRILLESLGVNRDVYGTYTTTLSERIERIVEEKLSTLSSNLFSQTEDCIHRLQERIQERIQALEAQVVTLPTRGQVESQPVLDSAVHDSVNTVDELLTGKELAERLEVDPGTLTKNRTKPAFANWTRDRDPEGISWQYLSEVKRYTPVLSTGFE